MQVKNAPNWLQQECVESDFFIVVLTLSKGNVVFHLTKGLAFLSNFIIPSVTRVLT